MKSIISAMVINLPLCVFLLIINMLFVFHFKDSVWTQGAMTSVQWGASVERGKCITD